MEKHTLQGQKRELTQKTKKLRAAGFIPANVYGADGSHALSLPLKDTTKLLAQISESTVFYLSLDSKETPVMLSEIQRDPITNAYVHIALRQVDLRKKVTAKIPVETTGLFAVPGAYYNLVHDEIEAEALPTDLPESFTIDLAALKAIGDEVTFADLAYDRSKVTLQIDDEKLPVLVVNEIVETPEEEEPTPAAQEEAPAAETEAAPAEEPAKE